MSKIYEAVITANGQGKEKISSYSLDILSNILRDKGNTFLDGVRATLFGRTNEDGEELIITEEKAEEGGFFITGLLLCKEGKDGPVYLDLYSVIITITETREIEFESTKEKSVESFCPWIENFV